MLSSNPYYSAFNTVSRYCTSWEAADDDINTRTPGTRVRDQDQSWLLLAFDESTDGRSIPDSVFLSALQTNQKVN